MRHSICQKRAVNPVYTLGWWIIGFIARLWRSCWAYWSRQYFGWKPGCCAERRSPTNDASHREVPRSGLWWSGKHARDDEGSGCENYSGFSFDHSRSLLAHCLNLVLQDASRGCRSIRNALDLTGELTSFIRNSPNVASELRAVAENFDTKQKTSICLLDNYSSIMTALEHVSCSSNGEHGRRASGMLAFMEQFSTLFGLILSARVLGVAEELSRSLQSAHVTAQEAFSAAERTHENYKCARMKASSISSRLYVRMRKLNQNVSLVSANLCYQDEGNSRRSWLVTARNNEILIPRHCIDDNTLKFLTSFELS